MIAEHTLDTGVVELIEGLTTETSSALVDRDTPQDRNECAVAPGLSSLQSVTPQDRADVECEDLGESVGTGSVSRSIAFGIVSTSLPSKTPNLKSPENRPITPSSLALNTSRTGTPFAAKQACDAKSTGKKRSLNTSHSDDDVSAEGMQKQPSSLNSVTKEKETATRVMPLLAEKTRRKDSSDVNISSIDTSCVGKSGEKTKKKKRLRSRHSGSGIKDDIDDIFGGL